MGWYTVRAGEREDVDEEGLDVVRQGNVIDGGGVEGRCDDGGQK